MNSVWDPMSLSRSASACHRTDPSDAGGAASVVGVVVVGAAVVAVVGAAVVGVVDVVDVVLVVEVVVDGFRLEPCGAASGGLPAGDFLDAASATGSGRSPAAANPRIARNTSTTRRRRRATFVRDSSADAGRS